MGLPPRSPHCISGTYKFTRLTQLRRSHQYTIKKLTNNMFLKTNPLVRISHTEMFKIIPSNHYLDYVINRLFKMAIKQRRKPQAAVGAF